MKKSLYPPTKLWMLGVAAMIVMLFAVFLGPTGIPNREILLEVRLPRVLLGFLVGCGLACSGAVFQGVLRNPLADPFILGTSSAATFGVMLANLLGWREYYLLYSMALGCALLSIAFVYRIAMSNGRTPVQTVVLSGVVVSLFLNAVVFIFFSLFYRESFTILFYLLGTLSNVDFKLVVISGVIIVVSFLICWLFARDLNVLTQGEDVAFHLGMDVETAQRIFFVAASSMTAACVAVAGMIGFVGLVIPHMMRMIVGPDYRYLIWASALGGAIILILTDAAARTLVPPMEIPVGALTALFGAPYFLFLLRKRKATGEV